MWFIYVRGGGGGGFGRSCGNWDTCCFLAAAASARWLTRKGRSQYCVCTTTQHNTASNPYRQRRWWWKVWARWTIGAQRRECKLDWHFLLAKKTMWRTRHLYRKRPEGHFQSSLLFLHPPPPPPPPSLKKKDVSWNSSAASPTVVAPPPLSPGI